MDIDNLYAKVYRGRQRRLVFKHLSENPKTAQQLRKDINQNDTYLEKPLSLREMSRHLSFFVKEGLAKSLDPDAPYNKPFTITSTGKKVQKLLKD